MRKSDINEVLAQVQALEAHLQERVTQDQPPSHHAPALDLARAVHRALLEGNLVEAHCQTGLLNRYSVDHLDALLGPLNFLCWCAEHQERGPSRRAADRHSP